MHGDTIGQQRPAPRRKWWQFAVRRPAPTVRNDKVLRLASCGRAVEVFDALDRPLTAMLAAEDAAWQFGRGDWSARKPPVWRTNQRRAWKAEGTRLEEKRLRLVELAGGIRTFRTAGGAGT